MFPVSDTNRPADMAGLTGIGRIYQDQRNACLKCLVAQEFSELVEGPTINPSSSISPGLLVNILSNSCKILQSYLSRDILSSDYNSLADFMVNLSLIPALLSRQPLLKLSTSSSRASCAFRSFLLENSSHGLIMFLNTIDRLAAKLLAFRGYCDIGNAKVDTKNFVGLNFFGRFALGLNIDVILIPLLTECRTRWLGAFEPTYLIVSVDQLNSLPRSEKGKTYRFVLLSEGKDPGVIVDTGRLKILDNRMVFQSGLTVGGNTVDRSDCEIGRETELVPDVLVNHVVNHYTVSKVLRHGLIDPVTSISKHLQGIIYLGYLFRRWGELTYCGQY